MQIDDKLLDRLERLSSLKFSEDKREALESELSEIIGFVENLNELSIDGVDATFTTLEGGTHLQADEVVDSKDVSKSILENAPKSEDNFFIVPKIIE